MDNKYITGKEASLKLGVHQRTLYQWDKKGWIETIRTDGNKRLYNVDKYLKDKICNKEEKECKLLTEDLKEIKTKQKIIYARVSSHGQKDDLERQKKLLQNKYPEYTLIEDIGSGLNLNKRGIRKIIDLAINGKIKEVVVVHKDRLTRFGFELIEDLINKYSEGKITVINKKKEITPEEELVLDVIQIMNVFTAKMNGLRKYKKKDNK
jgi:predicted site-specific integrase-resolvase